MTIRELYDLAVAVGRRKELRGPEALDRKLVELQTEYDGLGGLQRRLFDRERLNNPFGDTRLLCGDPQTPLRRVLISIEVDVAEVCLAAQLTGQGQPIDLVLSHHMTTVGGLGSAWDVAEPRVQMMINAGVPAVRAEKLFRQEYGRTPSSSSRKVIQAAEALNLALMTIHSPADMCLQECAWETLQSGQPANLGELVELFNQWPEVDESIQRLRQGTEIVVGEARDPVGKPYVAFYGGWNPSPECLELLCDAGVDPFILVASGEPLHEVARRRKAAIVVVPHFPADSLGINLLLENIPPAERFEIVCAGNYANVKR
jgi:hypothetical protein